jgi:Icc-related predicted phosphoesterase
MNIGKRKVKIAAVGDLHVGESDEKTLRLVVRDAQKNADMLLLCGDLTNLGLEAEVDSLVSIIEDYEKPILAVLGNHDFESGKEKLVSRKLEEAGVKILDGNNHNFEIGGKKIGLTGVKGFGGGFNPYMWGRFGELEQKSYYDAIDSELQKLKIGLEALRIMELDARFVLLHFSPIRETVINEVPELFPFLGSSRIEEVINRYDVTAVFHGHSHFGSPQGKTGAGIPVYNVAMPLLLKKNINPPYRIFEA